MVWFISKAMDYIPWVKSYWKIVEDYRATCGADPLGARPDSKYHIRNQFPLAPLSVGLTIIGCYVFQVLIVFGSMVYVGLHSP